MRDRLSAAAVQALLTCPYRLSFVDETSSTNTDVKALAEQGEGEGLVLIADRQTEGRGCTIPCFCVRKVLPTRRYG